VYTAGNGTNERYKYRHFFLKMNWRRKTVQFKKSRRRHWRVSTQTQIPAMWGIFEGIFSRDLFLIPICFKLCLIRYSSFLLFLSFTIVFFFCRWDLLSNNKRSSLGSRHWMSRLGASHYPGFKAKEQRATENLLSYCS
jgi:hypothetical protein